MSHASSFLASPVLAHLVEGHLMEWISLALCEPATDDFVAVLRSGEYPDCAYLRRPQGVEPYWLTPDSVELDDVTHWMPLPEPPRAEQEQA